MLEPADNRKAVLKNYFLFPILDSVHLSIACSAREFCLKAASAWTDTGRAGQGMTLAALRARQVSSGD